MYIVPGESMEEAVRYKVGQRQSAVLESIDSIGEDFLKGQNVGTVGEAIDVQQQVSDKETFVGYDLRDVFQGSSTAPLHVLGKLMKNLTNNILLYIYSCPFQVTLSLTCNDQNVLCIGKLTY